MIISSRTWNHVNFASSPKKASACSCLTHADNTTTIKTICRNVSIFFKNGPKFYSLLQIERDYCSIRPAPRKTFLGAGHPLTTPKNERHFQGRFMASPAPKKSISRGGWRYKPPLKMVAFVGPSHGLTCSYKCIFRGRWWHGPPLQMVR